MVDKQRLVRIIFILIVFIAIGIIANFPLSKISPAPKSINKEDFKEEVKKEVNEGQNQPSKFPDYNLLESFKPLTVAKDIESYALTPNEVSGRVEKTLYPKGQFSRMYILIKASVDYGKPLSAYDDVWLTFNFRGGHIFPRESLPTPPSDISWLLYSAQELAYRPTHTSFERRVVDVLRVFNERTSLGVDVFLSTARKGGKIHEMTLYYECVENAECMIED